MKLFRTLILSLLYVFCLSCGAQRAAVQYSEPEAGGESVNVGYGKTDKDSNNYSVSKVTVDQKRIGSYNSIVEYINGQVPGVQVIPVAGSDPKIIVRGVSSNSSNSSPLFIVDGVQVSSIYNLDPNNIYSVEVLKDSSASIYGVQGGNGVLLITTMGAHLMEEQAAAEKAAARAAAREARKEGRNK